MFELDSLDKKIIDLMQNDCRKSFREIAKTVGSTTVTVINRVRKLEEAGVIKGYIANMNYEKLGFTLTGVISIIASDRQSLKKLEKDLGKYPNILGVYEVTGEVDVVLIGKFKDLKHLQNFVKEEILASGAASKTISNIVTSIYKENDKVSIA